MHSSLRLDNILEMKKYTLLLKLINYRQINHQLRNDGMINLRDWYMCQNCTDDKQQYYNHCYRRGGVDLMGRFCRKRGVTRENSSSLGRDTQSQMRSPIVVRVIGGRFLIIFAVIVTDLKTVM